MIASTDADGAVKLWDVRMVAEILTVECSKYPANKAAFDASGAVSAISLLQFLGSFDGSCAHICQMDAQLPGYCSTHFLEITLNRQVQKLACTSVTCKAERPVMCTAQAMIADQLPTFGTW